MTVEQPGRIGVDIGAVSLKAVRIDSAGRVVQSFYARHKGEPAPVLERALRELDLAPGDAIGFCGLNATRFCEAFETRRLDIAACQIRVVPAIFPEVRNIIDIGGGSVTLVQLDAQGHFQNYATNSMCAAGTGSFLDEQAARWDWIAAIRPWWAAWPSRPYRHPLLGVRQERSHPSPARRLQQGRHVVRACAGA